MPSEYYLCRCLAVCLCYIRDRFIAKQVLRMTSAAERIPRFYHRTVFGNIFLKLRVLIKRMIFILNYRRLDLTARCDTLIFIEGIIVRNTDRTQLSVPYTLTQSFVDLGIIAARLMYAAFRPLHPDTELCRPRYHCCPIDVSASDHYNQVRAVQANRQ